MDNQSQGRTLKNPAWRPGEWRAYLIAGPVGLIIYRSVKAFIDELRR